jgi:hypothetical protein
MVFARQPLLVAFKRAVCAGFGSEIWFCRKSFVHGVILAWESGFGQEGGRRLQQFAIQNIYQKSWTKIGKKRKTEREAGSFLPYFGI